MSVTATIKSILGLTDDAEEYGLEFLQELLSEREANLSLTAEYAQPYPNMTDEPTVAFPYTLRTSDGEEYGAGVKEFVLPDNGLNDEDSALVGFIGRQLGIGPSDVDFEALASVEGTESSAVLNDQGDVEVLV